MSKVTELVTRDLPFVGKAISELFLAEPSAVRDRFDYFEIAPWSRVYTLGFLNGLIEDFDPCRVFQTQFWGKALRWP